MMNDVTPTPGFEFPPDARDTIEQSLRTAVGGDKRQPLKSVRPDRQRPPVVTPTAPVHTPAPRQAQPPAPQHKTVPVVQSSPALRSEAEAISIELPSRFHYYTFSDLYVRPFRLPHLSKISKAHETGSMQTLAEAVSAVLSTPDGDQDIAFKLSIHDFNAVLYWLRLNSFSKKQMRIKWKCTNPEHVHAVEVGAKPPESLNVESVYTESSMQFRMLDEAPDPEHYFVTLDGYGRVDLRPETVADVIDFMDHPDWENPEFQYSARVASVLGLVHPDGTNYRLTEKIAAIDDMSPDDVLLALEFADRVVAFGVDETTTTKCIGCGASTSVKIAVDALSFLSPAF